MKNSLVTICLLSAFSTLLAETPWHSKSLLSEFYSEDASTGDINGDGAVDVIYGPFWWEGPDFETQHRFTPGEAFDGYAGYSDNFFNFVHDFDADGDNDIVVFGFPGAEVRLYLNPGHEAAADSTEWEMHQIIDQLAHESPYFIDLIPGGLPEIVGARDTHYGFYTAGDDPTQPWAWHAVSEEKRAHPKFGHGFGVGDVNGDGRDDIIEKTYLYLQPEDSINGEWKERKWASLPYGGGGAQILVDDVDGDGDADLITSLNAHAWGIAWFEQFGPGKFKRHDIIGESSTGNPYGVAFSQPHAMALADLDGDGRNDFVTGKRYMAHRGKDPGALQDPVVYWFRNVETEKGVEFVPHFVDDDSGVGVGLTVADLNADGALDIISGNKRGLAIHLRNPEIAFTGAEKWATEKTPQEQYQSGLSPKETVPLTDVPEGFSVDLIAAEPEVTQPIAMTFDARGRIWVIEGHTYPVRDKGGYHDGKDRILIFEDSDADGSFETKKVFAENINLASGIEVGFGGVYVGAAPYLLFYPDKDQNDVPDGEPEILLDGWGYQDTHETLNAFTWGPDGWLYGCHGVFTHSKVGKPGTPDDQRQPINAGLWRFHPVSKQFELYAHGTSNPWGVDFNEYGDFFVSACVIPHFYHLSHGGRYQRQAGQHFDPFTFDDIRTIADHAHYAGDKRILWAERRGANGAAKDINFTNMAGGGHAHCGLAYYDAPEFPAAYRGQMYFHNLHGHRIVREDLGKNGSGYIAQHRPDFVLTNNHEFVGVGVMQGPDGALYYSDWVDPQTCHHRDVEIWNRSNGRIFRVRHGEVKTAATDLPNLSDTELVATLGHANSFHARQAQRLLHERAASGTLDREAVAAALTAFESEHGGDVPLRLRAFWTRHVTGTLKGEQMMSALSDPDEHIRGWAIQIAVANEGTMPRFVEMARNDDSLVVRRYLASKLQTLNPEHRWDIVRGLIAHNRSQWDPNIPYLTWYGIAPLVESDPDKALTLVNQTSWPILKDFITRRAAVFPKGRTAITYSLSKANSPKDFVDQSNQLLTALASLPPVETPDGWTKAKEKGKSFGKNAQVADVLSRLGTRFRDADYFPKWRAIAQNGKVRPADRIRAVELLTIGRDPELGDLARKLLSVPPLRSAAIAALRLSPGTETATAIVDILPELSLELRNEAINLLGTRPEMALVLLEAVDAKKVQPSLVSPVMLDQFERFENEQITALIDQNWMRGGAGVDLEELHAAIEGWKKKLTPKMITQADVSKGRQAYMMTCGTCHQLFGEGIAMGPDLTGSNRADLGYILENVLAPNAVVSKEYMLNIFTMKDGSTLSGMIASETPEFVKLSMPGGTTTDVKKSEIESRQEMTQSLMPAGLFDALPLDQVAALVKYLASPKQVPMPGEAAKPMPKGSQIAPPGEGVIRIEAESLVDKYQPERGEGRAQGMGNFQDAWSGDRQLWWRGGKPGDIYTLKLEDLDPGTYEVTIFATQARDYATAKFAINGQLRNVDFYHPKVTQAEPIAFEGINVSPTEPLQIDIHLTGKNKAAVANFMVGLDRIELKKIDSPQVKTDNKRNPNVVIIFTDDLGYGDLGCYGATHVETPNIDQLAEEGRRFTDAHSASATCTPSRYALLTGRYPSRKDLFGPVFFRTPLVVDPDRTTIADLAKEKGYATACIGKWHLGWGNRTPVDWNASLKPGPNELGFDYYFGVPVVNSHAPFVYVENDSVVGLTPEDPFVYGKDSVTRDDWDEKRQIKGAIGGAEAAHRLYDDEAVGTVLTEKATSWIQEQAAAKKPFLLYYATTHIHHPFTPAKRFQGTSKAGIYGDFIHELDWIVGEVTKSLEEAGVEEETLIVFTSDNGGMLNLGGQEARRLGHKKNGDLLGFKFDVWEGGHRVPWIVKWPGKVPAGTESDALISNVDLMATLSSILDRPLSPTEGEDSFDLLPAFTGSPDTEVRDHLLLAPAKASHLGIRSDDWVYIPAQGHGGFNGKKVGDHGLGGAAAHPFTGHVHSDIENGAFKAKAPRKQLYHLGRDPNQTQNVFRKHQVKANELSALLRRVKEKPTAPHVAQ